VATRSKRDSSALAIDVVAVPVNWSNDGVTLINRFLFSLPPVHSTGPVQACPAVMTAPSRRLLDYKVRMKHLIPAVAAATAGMLSAAAAEPVVAKLQAPQGAMRLVAGRAVFECAGDICAARTPSADTATLRVARNWRDKLARSPPSARPPSC